MAAEFSRQDLHQALNDIIEGKTVKRSRHELIWNARDVSQEFLAALEEAGYKRTLVEAVDIRPGERVPAFTIDDGVAFFGWVFWEKFSSRKLRKLFGSVIRNAKGDWAVQIPVNGRSVIFANSLLKSEMDIENPSGV